MADLAARIGKRLPYFPNKTWTRPGLEEEERRMHAQKQNAAQGLSFGNGRRLTGASSGGWDTHSMECDSEASSSNEEEVHTPPPPAFIPAQIQKTPSKSPKKILRNRITSAEAPRSSPPGSLMERLGMGADEPEGGSLKGSGTIQADNLAFSNGGDASSTKGEVVGGVSSATAMNLVPSTSNGINTVPTSSTAPTPSSTRQAPDPEEVIPGLTLGGTCSKNVVSHEFQGHSSGSHAIGVKSATGASGSSDELFKNTRELLVPLIVKKAAQRRPTSLSASQAPSKSEEELSSKAQTIITDEICEDFIRQALSSVSDLEKIGKLPVLQDAQMAGPSGFSSPVPPGLGSRTEMNVATSTPAPTRVSTAAKPTSVTSSKVMSPGSHPPPTGPRAMLLAAAASHILNDNHEPSDPSPRRNDVEVPDSRPPNSRRSDASSKGKERETDYLGQSRGRDKDRYEYRKPYNGRRSRSRSHSRGYVPRSASGRRRSMSPARSTLSGTRRRSPFEERSLRPSYPPRNHVSVSRDRDDRPRTRSPVRNGYHDRVRGRRPNSPPPVARHREPSPPMSVSSRAPSYKGFNKAAYRERSRSSSRTRTYATKIPLDEVPVVRKEREEYKPQRRDGPPRGWSRSPPLKGNPDSPKAKYVKHKYDGRDDRGNWPARRSSFNDDNPRDESLTRGPWKQRRMSGDIAGSEPYPRRRMSDVSNPERSPRFSRQREQHSPKKYEHVCHRTERCYHASHSVPQPQSQFRSEKHWTPPSGPVPNSASSSITSFDTQPQFQTTSAATMHWPQPAPYQANYVPQPPATTAGAYAYDPAYAGFTNMSTGMIPVPTQYQIPTPTPAASQPLHEQVLQQLQQLQQQQPQPLQHPSLPSRPDTIPHSVAFETHRQVLPDGTIRQVFSYHDPEKNAKVTVTKVEEPEISLSWDGAFTGQAYDSPIDLDYGSASGSEPSRSARASVSVQRAGTGPTQMQLPQQSGDAMDVDSFEPPGLAGAGKPPAIPGMRKSKSIAEQLKEDEEDRKPDREALERRRLQNLNERRAQASLPTPDDTNSGTGSLESSRIPSPSRDNSGASSRMQTPTGVNKQRRSPVSGMSSMRVSATEQKRSGSGSRSSRHVALSKRSDGMDLDSDQEKSRSKSAKNVPVDAPMDDVTPQAFEDQRSAESSSAGASTPWLPVPGVWIVQQGIPRVATIEQPFTINSDQARELGLSILSDADARNVNMEKKAAKPRIKIQLLCFPTESVANLDWRHPESLLGLKQMWPMLGDVVVDVNHGTPSQQIWFHNDMPNTDGSGQIIRLERAMHAGENTLRIMQMADLTAHTFVLFASLDDAASTSKSTTKGKGKGKGKDKFDDYLAKQREKGITGSVRVKKGSSSDDGSTESS